MAARMKHGMEGTRLYRIWVDMKRRCDKPNRSNYHQYGGRGISYDPSFRTFEGFLAGMPDGYREDLTIERIDVDGDYVPGNIRWATTREQSINKRTSVKYRHPITGEMLPADELCAEYGIGRSTFLGRIKRGDNVEEALTRRLEATGRGYDNDLAAKVKRACWHMGTKDVALWHNVSIDTVKRIKYQRSHQDVDEYY